MTRSEFVSGLGHSRTHPELLPTVLRMSPEELKAVTDDVGGASPSHNLVRYADPSIFDATFRRALLDRAIWPNLRVEYTWCTMSIDETVYVAWFLAQVMHESENHRKFTTHALKANHFVCPCFLPCARQTYGCLSGDFDSLIGISRRCSQHISPISYNRID